MVDDDDKHEHLSPQEIAFMEGGGGNGRGRLYDKSGAVSDYKPVERRRRRTKGSLPAGSVDAWVYVATDASGCIKIGMSSNTPQRMRGLAADLRLQVHTTPGAARYIETEAFHELGLSIEDGEWFVGDPASAMAAVWTAYTKAARLMRVHPSLTEDDARRMRIKLAGR